MLRQSFVANIDPAESRLDKRVLTARAAGGSAQARTTRQVELWHAIGLVLMLLLAGESLPTRRG